MDGCWSRLVWLPWMLLACGPVVGVGDSDGTDGGGDGTTAASVGTTVGGSTVGTSPGTTSPGTTIGTTDPDTDPTFDESGPWVLDFGDGGDGCQFLCEPDGGGTDIECDVWSQDCPRGEKCQAWANDGGAHWNAAHCSPLDPNPGFVGDACTVEGSAVSGIDTCDLGSMCFFVDPETNHGVCVARCSGLEPNPTCFDPSTSCSLSHDGVLVLCLPVCDPLLQDCLDAQTCVPDGEQTAFHCFPRNGAGADPGQPCDSHEDCATGNVCVDAVGVPGCNGDACCTPYCDANDPESDAACPGFAEGQVCAPWFDDGMTPLGLCIVPQ